jgi:uncharacterized tellurite resistance protein B-like protein
VKNQEFKDFLFRSAVIAMACDGDIVDTEIEEIKSIVANEIYFMGYDFEIPLKNCIDDIKTKGKASINQYLQDLEAVSFSEHQKLLLIEVLLRIIEADDDVKSGEIKFLQMVKAKLNVDQQTLIVKFPKQIEYLIDFHNFGLLQEFTDEI